MGSLSSKISLTIDGWASENNEPFLGITAHFINDNWETKAVYLAIFYFTHPHTGEAIAAKLYEVC